MSSSRLAPDIKGVSWMVRYLSSNLKVVLGGCQAYTMANFTMLAAFGSRYLHDEESRHIHDWLPSLFTEATRFLYSYDLGCVEELVVWPPSFFGNRPSRVAPSPLSWLLSVSLRPGGPEVHSAIASLMLRHGDRIPRTIPVIRKQTYQLSPTSFSRVTGLLPDGRVSGRHSQAPCARSVLPEGVALQLPLPSLSWPARRSSE
jgi:hypothetical protein